MINVIFITTKTLSIEALKRNLKLICAFTVLGVMGHSCAKADPQKNPLAYTEWTGMARISVESEVILTFSDIKLDILFENKVIESMKFTVKDHLVILEKISGGSPREMNVKGEYIYEVIGDKFAMSLFKDDCATRTSSIKDNTTRTSSTN